VGALSLEAMAPALFLFSCFFKQGFNFAWAGLVYNLPDLHLLSSWDYRYEPGCPADKLNFIKTTIICILEGNNKKWTGKSKNVRTYLQCIPLTKNLHAAK
jgi:hypothetical protein